MSVTGGISILLFLFVVVVPTVLLYLFIRAETSNPTVLDRDEAEREAKAQGGLRDRSNDRRERTTNERDERDDQRPIDREESRDGTWWDER